MAIRKDTLDQLLDGRDPKEVFNKDGLFERAEEGAGRTCFERRDRRSSGWRGQPRQETIETAIRARR